VRGKRLFVASRLVPQPTDLGGETVDPSLATRRLGVPSTAGSGGIERHGQGCDHGNAGNHIGSRRHEEPGRDRRPPTDKGREEQRNRNRPAGNGHHVKPGHFLFHLVQPVAGSAVGLDDFAEPIGQTGHIPKGGEPRLDGFLLCHQGLNLLPLRLDAVELLAERSLPDRGLVVFFHPLEVLFPPLQVGLPPVDEAPQFRQLSLDLPGLLQGSARRSPRLGKLGHPGADLLQFAILGPPAGAPGQLEELFFETLHHRVVVHLRKTRQELLDPGCECPISLDLQVPLPHVDGIAEDVTLGEAPDLLDLRQVLLPLAAAPRSRNLSLESPQEFLPPTLHRLDPIGQEVAGDGHLPAVVGETYPRLASLSAVPGDEAILLLAETEDGAGDGSQNRRFARFILAVEEVHARPEDELRPPETAKGRELH